MGSKYQKSVRGPLTLWAFMLEVTLILIFFFFTSYETSVKEQKKLMRTYREFQDVIIMAVLGLGFLNTSLRRHCWSSVAFSLFVLALGVQLTVLLDGFLNQLSLRKMVLNLSSIQISTMSATSVLISVGVILGKVNLLQLLLMTLIEVTAFSATRMVGKEVFNTHIHNAVLAGGVAVGAPCYLIPSPWLAMVLGLLAGLISIWGAMYLQVCLQRTLDLHDTYGVQYTFGLPGLLGGITNIVLMALQVKWTKISTLGYQILTDSGAFSFTIIMGVGSGLLTGMLLNLKIWKSPHVVNYFNDQTFWKLAGEKTQGRPKNNLQTLERLSCRRGKRFFSMLLQRI
ncbi:blood group Rh(CE) polypeptide isoform X4 [Neophocaena asiaeorientalis asiaeorientalis]|uniref:Blood group Rh(CE) polypeptide isoform X4 n=1 Tax=Neophocaena asiaeorientalis asiaeorientalis TaxID=1706337 RepID=A0A341D6W8_NEOAA|nr:blood group Rh(CE) polypeptide isoform X4 [Neophocaena asiaeorientalis asiaeorientalis]